MERLLSLVRSVMGAVVARRLLACRDYAVSRNPGAVKLPTLAIAITWALTPTEASAHSPIEGVGTFYSYLLHPILVPTHAMVLIAMALLLGQQGRAAASVGIASLGATFFIGFAASTLSALAGLREPLFFAAALIMGAGIVADRQIPTMVCTLSGGLVGLLVGLDSAAASTNLREIIFATAGLSLGVLYVTTVIAGFTTMLAQPWQRIGIRVIASWISAAALLMLALDLAPAANRSVAAEFDTPAVQVTSC